MNRRRVGKTVWLLLGFIFVEMFISHVFPLLRETHLSSSLSTISNQLDKPVDATELAPPIQHENDGLADHCCVCSCTHMLISKPAHRTFFTEVHPVYSTRTLAFPLDPPPGALTPPPKFS